MEKRALQLVRRRMRLVAFLLTAALLFYFLLPLSLMMIPAYINRPSSFFQIPRSWLYEFFQNPMTRFFCWLYHVSAKKCEQQLERIVE